MNTDCIRTQDLTVSLSNMRLDQLQEAVRSNLVSFPSQVPVFVKHAEGALQCRIVLLYFVSGWSCDRIAKRYDVTRQRIWQIVREWCRHALELGYVQAIPPPEALLPLRSSFSAVPSPAPAALWSTGGFGEALPAAVSVSSHHIQPAASA